MYISTYSISFAYFFSSNKHKNINIKSSWLSMNLWICILLFLLRFISWYEHAYTLDEHKGILRKEEGKVRKISQLKSSTYVSINDNIVKSIEYRPFKHYVIHSISIDAILKSYSIYGSYENASSSKFVELIFSSFFLFFSIYSTRKC